MIVKRTPVFNRTDCSAIQNRPFEHTGFSVLKYGVKVSQTDISNRHINMEREETGNCIIPPVCISTSVEVKSMAV